MSAAAAALASMAAMFEGDFAPSKAREVADRSRERRIASLGRLLNEATRNNEKAEATRLWEEMRVAILVRSPEQQARMTKEQLSRMQEES